MAFWQVKALPCVQVVVRTLTLKEKTPATVAVGSPFPELGKSTLTPSGSLHTETPWLDVSSGLTLFSHHRSLLRDHAGLPHLACIGSHKKKKKITEQKASIQL